MKPTRRLPPLALLDWGIGGLGVRSELRKRRPGLAVTYVSDSGARPYGRLEPRALRARLDQVVDTLAHMGVEQVFFACNAASTVLERGQRFGVPVHGMIDAGVDAVIAHGARRVGIVGGRRTVTSGVYRRALSEHGVEIRQRIAQPLSAAIEAGRAEHGETKALVRDIVGPLRSMEAILLACTHYPAASAAFAEALPGVALVDPASIAARKIVESWLPFDRADASSDDVVLTTGDRHAMRDAAMAAFGISLPRIDALVVGESATPRPVSSSRTRRVLP